jgi:hypothetical protein
MPLVLKLSVATLYILLKKLNFVAVFAIGKVG